MSSIRPLSGVTVIEIGHSVAAPYAGMILGELGADVIKVENPKGGDACRSGLTAPFIKVSAADRRPRSILRSMTDGVTRSVRRHNAGRFRQCVR